MCFAVNIPVSALVKISIPDLVRAQHDVSESWPGLIIDVTEDQIVTDLALASELAKKLAHVNVKLAIDDFGRGYLSLARLKELPFAELKLDRTFVTDCGTDKVNARYARPSSTWPIISAAMPSASGSRRQPTRWR